MVVIKKKYDNYVETFGDDAKIRGVRMWGLVSVKDLDGEITPEDSMKEYLDWFVTPHSMGGHGGPMNVNHSNKVVGHWNKWGTAIHPKTGKESVYLEGVVHRGPNGQPFPNADKVWSAFKEGKVKGTSWGGTIMEESDHYSDKTGLKEFTTNDKVQPYEWSVVLDWDGEEHNPAVPEAEPIIYNDIAKTTETEVTEMPEEETKTEEVTEEVKEETFDVKKEFEAFESKILSLIDEKMKEGSAPMTPPKRDEEDEDEEEDEKEKEDDKKEVTEIPDSWKEQVDKMVDEKVKEKLKTIVTEQVTPPPPQVQEEETKEKVKETEVIDKEKYLKMNPRLRMKYDREHDIMKEE